MALLTQEFGGKVRNDGGNRGANRPEEGKIFEMRLRGGKMRGNGNREDERDVEHRGGNGR